MNYETFMNLPRLTQSFILHDTFLEFETGVQQQHSFQTIFNENRLKAVGCRMLSKGYITINGKSFTGKEVADIYIKSVLKNDFCWYPLTGEGYFNDIEQIILFIREGNKTIPYARFDVNEIVKTSVQPANFNQLCIEPNLLKAFRYKTLVKISNVETKNLPKSFVGISSGRDVYDCAFRGSAPNVLII